MKKKYFLLKMALKLHFSEKLTEKHLNILMEHSELYKRYNDDIEDESEEYKNSKAREFFQKILSTYLLNKDDLIKDNLIENSLDKKYYTEDEFANHEKYIISFLNCKYIDFTDSQVCELINFFHFIQFELINNLFCFGYLKKYKFEYLSEESSSQMLHEIKNYDKNEFIEKGKEEEKDKLACKYSTFDHLTYWLNKKLITINYYRIFKYSLENSIEFTY